MDELRDVFVDYPEFIPDVDDYIRPNCKYANVECLSDFINGIPLTILMLNIRSCNKNFDQFLSTFCNYISSFTCIILTETWLSEYRDNIFNIDGFYCIDLYRNNYGGGIKVYLKNFIKSKVLGNFNLLNDVMEMLTIELSCSNHRFLLTTVYHPPTSFPVKNMEFVDLFTLYLKQLVDLKIPLIVAGDLNINLLNPNNCVYIDTYIKNLFELGLKPLVTLPTKVNLENIITRFSIIDHIWVSNKLRGDGTLIVPVNITDHFPIVSIISTGLHQISNVSTKRRRLTQRRKETFRMFLSNIHVNIVGNNMDTVYNVYFAQVLGDYDRAFPIENYVMKSKHSSAWITPKLKECIKKKAKLYREYLKGHINKRDYTTYKNRLINVIRKSKALYYAQEVLKSANNSKILWSTINSILNRKDSQKLREVKVDDEVLTGKELADYVNRYFVNAAKTVTRGLPQVQGFVCLSVRMRESCFFFPTDYNEVCRVIKSLKNRGSKIFDIHPSILKENLDIFSTHFVQLYNSSLEQAWFPGKLKIARVNPGHKSGPPDKVDNYRPISVLPLFSKVFEKLTLNRMNSFIARHNILTPSQFGFRKGCSTTNAIIKLVTHVVEAYHKKVYCACFFLDLRKAFDTIDHKILLFKLEHYGFRGQCYGYLKSYYQNREQFVHLNDHNSDTMPIVCGVPQGSILGPLCFNLFINDLPLAVEDMTVLFADDAAFVLTANTLDGLLEKIRNLFSDIAGYLRVNKLVPNAAKSKLMMFTSRPTVNLPVMLFEGKEIEWVSEFKYLGLTLTNNLSFSKHINKIALNLSRITGTFINLRSFLPIHILIKLYYALAFPHIQNHIVVWGASPSCQLKSLSVRINNMLRIIQGVTRVNGRPTLSNNQLYKELGLLNLASIFKLNLFKFLKLLIDGELPELFNILLSLHIAPHSYNTRHIRFRHPALVCEIERRALSHQLILLYENIPRDIFEINFRASCGAFKRLLLENQ